MRIGIDISQIIYEGTGVSNFVKEAVRHVVTQGRSHTFILFGSSLRKQSIYKEFFLSLPTGNISLVLLPFPTKILDILWNRLHIMPIELFIGNVDVFWSSDWLQPPLLRAKGVTTIHDLTPFYYPEVFSKIIVDVHHRKLKRSLACCKAFFCDSVATKNDLLTKFHVPEHKVFVIYPGSGI